MVSSSALIDFCTPALHKRACDLGPTYGRLTLRRPDAFFEMPEGVAGRLLVAQRAATSSAPGFRPAPMLAAR